jgi:hypothetical protein
MKDGTSWVRDVLELASVEACRTDKYCGHAADYARGKYYLTPEREILFLKEFFSGNVPSWMSQLVKLTITKGDLSITMCVAPDYMSMGSNEDYLRFPLTPIAGVVAANKLGMALPTKSIVDDIYNEASTNGKTIHIPGLNQAAGDGMWQMGAGFYYYHNWKIKEKLTSSDEGKLIAGHKKDPIISSFCANKPADLDFFGYYSGPHQPTQTNPHHPANFADYSHGIRLIHKQMWVTEGGTRLAGTSDYFTLLADPKYAKVLNHGFPMTGKGNALPEGWTPANQGACPVCSTCYTPDLIIAHPNAKGKEGGNSGPWATALKNAVLP